MKIGIMTFHYSKNFGAMLQAYALKCTLSKLGYNAELINYACRSDELIYHEPEKIRAKEFIHPKKVLTHSFLLRYKEDNKKTWEQFDLFMNEKLKVHGDVKEYTWQLLKNEYDVIICGSDQIWNPEVTKGVRKEYFADVDKKVKRIAYAASVGDLSSIKNYKECIKTEIQKMDFVSVREDDLQEYLSQEFGLNSELVLDPTLLLDKEDYANIETCHTLFDGPYILTYNIRGMSNKVSKQSKQISRKMRLPNIEISGKHIFPSEMNYRRVQAGGPSEFIWWIDNAKLVVTDSFHGVAFSIIFHKNFYYIPNKRTRRVYSLLKMLGLSNRIINDVNTLKYDDIDYDAIDEKISVLRAKSISFLKESIIESGKNSYKIQSYLATKEKKDCYGCGACFAVCPQKAIEMRSDEQGFEYPIINDSKCIKCNACINSCPMAEEKLRYPCSNRLPKALCARNSSDETIMNSSSGGVYAALSDIILDKGGVVVGAIYDENFSVLHSVAYNKTDRKQQQKSKYVQSKAYITYHEIQEELKKGRYVLFSGTSCQVAALKMYLKKDYNNLYTVDLFCVGASSPKIYKGYIDYLTKKYGEIETIDFRAKSDRSLRKTSKTLVRIVLKNGKIIEDTPYTNSYYRIQNSFVGLRPACFRCEFSSPIKPGDITIGDFREKGNIKLDTKRGVSSVLIHSEKGQSLLNETYEKGKLVYVDTDLSSVINAGIDSVRYYKKDRLEFWELFKNGYEDIAKKYGDCDIEKIVKSNVKRTIGL